MPTTTDRPAITCPYWCTGHEDANKPHPENKAELATYDETVDGEFVHTSYSPSTGRMAVHVSCCTDWAGNDLEPPVVFLDGYDMSVDEARQLARALLDASLRLVEPAIAERMDRGEHPGISAAMDAFAQQRTSTCGH